MGGSHFIQTTYFFPNQLEKSFHLFWFHGASGMLRYNTAMVRVSPVLETKGKMICWGMGSQLPLRTIRAVFPMTSLLGFPFAIGPCCLPALFSFYPSVHVCVCVCVCVYFSPLTLVIIFCPQRSLWSKTLQEWIFKYFSSGESAVMSDCLFRAIVYCSDKWKYQGEKGIDLTLIGLEWKGRNYR